MKTSKPWRIVATIPAGAVTAVDVTTLTAAVAELLRAAVPGVVASCTPVGGDAAEARLTTAEAARRCRLTRDGWLRLAKRRQLVAVDTLDVGAGRVARTWRTVDVERIAKERAGVPQRVRRSPRRRK
jgi:hypothetical protein